MAVNHRKDSIQLIRDTEGINNKDRVRILSPGSSPPGEQTEVTEHALYMELENTPGDGEPYEYEFACCTGRRFIPQRAGDANKLEGKTSAEVKALFADGRAVFAGSGTSVTLDAESDRVHSITVNGFTKQTGSGTPSQENQMPLTNGGMKLVELVLSGTEEWSKSVYSNGNDQFSFRLPVLANSLNGYCSDYKYDTSRDIGSIIGGENLYIYPGNNIYTVETWKAMLSDRYTSGDPVIVWYQPADESRATGIYAPIILQGSKYRATCLELTAPLCEGDSVVSHTKSGCDCVAVFDGSEDESWGVDSTFGKRYQIFGRISPNVVPYSKVYTNQYNAIAYLPTWSTYDYNKPIVAVDKNNVYVVWNSINSLEDLKTMLQKTPLVIYYRSAKYTEDNDKPVSLETHQQAVLEMDGTEPGSINPSGGYISVLLTAGKMPNLAKGGAYSGISSIAKAQYSTAGSGFYWIANSRNLIFGKSYSDQFESYAAFQSKLAELYAAGTPAQFVYRITTPVVYAHDPVDFEFVKGEDGVFTITGEADGTLDVYYKALQDGGDADKLGGKLPEYYAAAANALGQYTHTKSGTVHELTGTGDNIRFVATADFAAGDTVKVNGTTCTASTMSGDALWAGFFKSGAVVVCYRTGNALNFSGGGLAAAEAAKITPENLKTGVSVTVNGKTVA